MLKTRQDQSVVISGESGAGKTESANYILNCLSEMSGNNTLLINKQIIASSELLESFGNAKTIRNRNSSRFGKFIFIRFSKGKITGAHITTYLLERSRITSRAPMERTYHIFLYLLSGSSEEEKTKYKLLDFPQYNYLNGTATKAPGISDEKGFIKIKEIMNVIGLEEETQQLYFKILSAVLLIGNILFQEDEGTVTIKNQDGFLSFLFSFSFHFFHFSFFIFFFSFFFPIFNFQFSAH